MQFTSSSQRPRRTEMHRVLKAPLKWTGSPMNQRAAASANGRVAVVVMFIAWRGQWVCLKCDCTDVSLIMGAVYVGVGCGQPTLTLQLTSLHYCWMAVTALGKPAGWELTLAICLHTCTALPLFNYKGPAKHYSSFLLAFHQLGVILAIKNAPPPSSSPLQ